MELLIGLIAFILLIVVGGIVLAFLTALGWIVILACWFTGDALACESANTMYVIYGLELLGIAIFILCLPGVFEGAVQRIHYVFSEHPATNVVRRAQGGRALDTHAIDRSMYDKEKGDLPPAYVSENRARQARAATQRLKEETELMGQAIERERARRRLEDERNG